MSDEEKTEQKSAGRRPVGKGLLPCDVRRVLVADDEDEIREMFHMVLSCELESCRIDLAVNGAEVVDAFREAHPAVILLDINMPVMDGVKAYRQIKEMCDAGQWELPAFVFCTGYEPPHEVANIVAANPKHCVLHKPVNNDTLIESLRVRLSL